MTSPKKTGRQNILYAEKFFSLLYGFRWFENKSGFGSIKDVIIGKIIKIKLTD